MEIVAFDPDDAGATAAYAEVFNAANLATAPWRDPETPESIAGYLRYSWDLEPGTPYLGRVDGQVVAVGTIETTERDNQHFAWFDLSVRPDHQRRGHGSALLAHLEAEATRRGRTMGGFAADEHPALDGFAAHHGYERAYVEVERRQYLAEVDWPAVDAAYDAALPHAADYAFERHRFPTPAEDLAELAEVTAVINDAPTDDLAIEDEVYTADRVRDYEAAQLGRGHRMYRVVARHRGSGALAGHTVVGAEGARPGVGGQHDTAVSPDHRGHRLGLLLKVEMLRWLREVEPELDHIDTGNAGSNAHMIAINELLGYRVMARVPGYQRTL
ncbi:GNAT family N-acetyltransferase [Nocardioides panacisoli]|uniref:GNAT family N-acetyltransferase n=1 Tax=Nocardioides panacisoli TaxID=627624 RepID=UPI001C62A61F|nr:GNAT family N-acetyltransferase [Nocardioides panacisoli]QYJ04925.1 GNAT family N-acetyltransferase [Nocardioides panacisoli]